MGETEHLWLARTLRRLAFFADMTLGQLELILPHIELHQVSPGIPVITPGEDPRAIYILYRGKVSVRRKMWLLGRPEEVARLGDGDFFGEMAILEGRRHKSWVTAEEECLLFMLPATQFRYVLERNPALLAGLRKLSEERRKAERAARA